MQLSFINLLLRVVVHAIYDRTRVSDCTSLLLTAAKIEKSEGLRTRMQLFEVINQTTVN